jgi:hypothetical protein
MADFGQLSKEIETWQERAAWLVLKHPYTGEPIGGDEPARILMTSPLSKRWQEMDRTWQVERIVSRQRDAGKVAPDDIEKFESHRVRCYMAVTREWEHIERDGAPLPCVPVNMEWLYGLPWVRSQLLEFVSDLTNFGAPEGTPNGHVPSDILDDSEKKLLTGASGSSP